MTRWVPAPERRERPRPQQDTPRPPELQAYRSLLDPAQKPNGAGWRMVRQGALGLALVGVAGWLWKAGGDSRTEKDQQ